MTDGPDQPTSTPQNGAQRPTAGQTSAPDPAEAPKQRFNPFIHEDDMFKVVLWAGGIVVLLIILIVLARTIF